MENSLSFSAFIKNLGGDELTFSDTPFTVFSLKNGAILIHFIDLSLVDALQNRATFFVNWLTTHQPKHTKIITLCSDIWMSKTELIKNRIQSALGQNKRVFARQTEVVRLDKKTSDAFLVKQHLQGPTNAYYKFGLMHQQALIAVATFSKARTMYDGPVYYKSYELERFATNSTLNVVGGLSKLLKHFCNTTHAQHIMTYADRDWSNGNSYKQLGFIEQELSAPNLFWVDAHTNQRFFAKEIETSSPHLIEVYNTGSIKFIWNNT